MGPQASGLLSLTIVHILLLHRLVLMQSNENPWSFPGDSLRNTGKNDDIPTSQIMYGRPGRSAWHIIGAQEMVVLSFPLPPVRHKDLAVNT